ncbi:MAG: adenosylcobinamide-GDP ribazoletransferase [Bacteroidota bacterium]|nr:adenosylcobinamide-GDP ribazoletransferase [Bacteroidota bacterium]
MNKQIEIFFTALMYYTRIPCPKWVTHDADYLNKATRYFPLIGWIVGGISALVYYGAGYLFNEPVAAILSIVAGIFATGAFHEDGWGDVCDGFGGGWTKEKILVIMKDSRIGAYGVIGIILILLLKYTLLLSFHSIPLWAIIIAAHSFSRLCPILIVVTSKYVRENEDGKAKPLAKSITAKEFIPALILGIAPLALLMDIRVLAAVIFPLTGTIYLRWYFHKWIGGYTGDCLGATQQVTEILFYLNILAVWKYI